ncbi:hypothetical protein KAW65_04440 [candidate division WOR-3 bacterium]|nr:hypothetical protein [candidate division WOR-3 bacterium]
MFLLIFLLQLSPPLNVQVFDTPNDKGKSISIKWKLSPDDSVLSYYEVFRTTDKKHEYYSRGIVLRGLNKFDDSTQDGEKYWYKVRAVSPTDFADSEPLGPVISYAQWFHHKRWNALILGIVFCGLVLWYIKKAKHGGSLFIRKISGLEAVDDAVGRATESGKPILYLTGLSDMSDVATIASLSILGRVAKRAATYGTPLLVPCYDPIVMSAAQEVVKQAHMEAGRPDTYNESKIFYLTADQFGYAAGVNGIMLREKPGAVFLQGYFFAESLLLAETGNSIGAIQIAGTPATTQLPFFVAACDYTLIGEEMYAASSYLSKEPTLLGSIKGEDFVKLIIIIVISIGILLASLSSFGILKTSASNFINWFSGF